MAQTLPAGPVPTVIDLTQEAQMDEYQVPAKDEKTGDEPRQVTFITLAHRSPESTIPQKRKSVDASEVSSTTSTKSNGLPKDLHLSRLKATSTPSPTPSLASQNVSVVIPSPSIHQRRRMEAIKPPSNITGFSKTWYPIEDEKIKAAAFAYPRARSTNRSVVSLSLRPSDKTLSSPLPTQTSIRATLEQKLARVKGPPITISADCDRLLAKLAANFDFINDYKIQDGVEGVEDGFNAGCNCPIDCPTNKCECLTNEPDSNRKIVPYDPSPRGPPGTLILRPGFLNRKSMIYECSYRCKCKGLKCWNHVVQRGRQVRLEIFNTGKRGFGLRSEDHIVTGQFIDRYLGEVITENVADVRESLASAEGAQSYLFGLDFLVKDEDIFVIDGHKFGSATRFMNHSCNPNCKIIPVSTTNHADDRLYYLAFFALREIPPNTELTFDYNPTEGESSPPKKIDPNAVKCLCGEKNCRGQLWPNARKGQ
ncbi:hypothetical protein NUU61_006612 [Penicillium alfredii]|uniref:Uncharacterized protein n=1 Tax=Penicillium alfredii TaxID=1506179 RepID=A0A9W9K4F1_9EURO|nr:uncharacterized protein NUU61_006612 [Penicillium alfredii]KAJ5091742.1 hypothetical protein NUU61_006612 [Penicillium alfredii]